MWRKGNPFALLVEVQTGAATMENSMEISQKIKNGPAFWPSAPTLGNISEGTQNTNLKEHKHPYVHYSVIYSHQDVEAAQGPLDRWVDKTTMGHLQMEYYPIKKKKILPFVTAWMNVVNIMLREIRQREENTIWFHSYVESNEQTELTTQTETHS